MPMQTPTGVEVPPDISAVEEQLRRLGFASNPAGMMTMTPSPYLAGTPDPQSAVAGILAAQDAKFQQALAAGQAAQAPAPLPPPNTGGVDPGTNAAALDGGKESNNLNPLWALAGIPAIAAVAALARMGGAKGLTRSAAKGAKGPSSAAAAANAARGKVGMRPGTAKQGPPKPIRMGPNQPANYPRPMQGPQQPLELTDVVPPAPSAAAGVLPPPTLTQTDLPTLPDVLAQRARQMQRGGTAVRPALKPPAVIPENVAAMDAGADLSGNELTKAIRIADVLKERRQATAAKRAKKGRGSVAKSTNALLEPESAAFNTAASVVRQERPSSKTPKNLKPWEQEAKPAGTGGQPMLPPKKRGRNPKPKYKEVPETAKAIAERKVKPKRTPRSLAEQGKKPIAESKHSGNEFGKFVGRSGARTAKDEPAILRSLTTAEKSTALANAKRLLDQRNNPLSEKTGKTARAIRDRNQGKYKLPEDFKNVYGDGPEARALYDVAVAIEVTKRRTANTARNIKGK